MERFFFFFFLALVILLLDISVSFDVSLKKHLNCVLQSTISKSILGVFMWLFKCFLLGRHDQWAANILFVLHGPDVIHNNTSCYSSYMCKYSSL